MTAPYDVAGEKLLQAALEAAFSSPNVNGGRYLTFAVQRRGRVNESDLLLYCEQWYPLPQAKNQYDAFGYRPALGGPEDRSCIALHVGGAGVYIQGRGETVSCMAPIAACYSLGIPPDVGKQLPSSCLFWDGLEKFNQRRFAERPPTAAAAFIQLKHEKSYAPSIAAGPVTSRSVRMQKWTWNDVSEQQFGSAKSELTLRRFDKYRPVANVHEAESLIAEKVEEMDPSNSWVGTDMVHPHRICVGEFIWYMTQIWSDCSLTKCGTRWRPRSLPCGTDKGSIYLASSEGGGSKSICAIGKQYWVIAARPLMAACALKIDPEIAVLTPSFQVFWETVSCSPERARAIANPYRSGTSVIDCIVSQGMPAWATEADVADFNNEQFREVNAILEKQLFIQLQMFANRNGFWSGGSALPNVCLSKDDFIDWVCRWAPDSVVERTFRTRIRPGFLEKGGISMDDAGTYFAVETCNDSALAMLVILSAVMVGVAPETAALMPFANAFWDFVAGLESAASVKARRARLRHGRAEEVRHDDPARVAAKPDVSDREVKEIKSRMMAFKLSRFRHFSIEGTIRSLPRSIPGIEVVGDGEWVGINNPAGRISSDIVWTVQNVLMSRYTHIAKETISYIVESELGGMKKP